MLFTLVVSLYFSVMFAIAGLLEICLLRMNTFRRTQREEFPELCGLIEKVWTVLHLHVIFDDEDDESYEEASSTPHLEVIEHRPRTTVSRSYHRAA